MTYEEAMDSATYVSLREVIRELKAHSITSEDDLKQFFSEVLPEDNGLYMSRDVLMWLGY